MVHSVQVPQLLPGSRGMVPLAPRITREDERVIANVAIISNFLAGALLLRTLAQLADCMRGLADGTPCSRRAA